MSYGEGIYSHGEMLMNPEHDRLLGKKVFLQLLDHLIRHEEMLKAYTLLKCAPWHCEDDREILREAKLIEHFLTPFFCAENGSHEDLLRYIEWEETTAGPKAMEEAFQSVKRIPRIRWLMDRVIAENPSTVLDVGAGWGEIAVEIAKLGVHVTAMSPFERGTQLAKQIQGEKGLPIQWIHDIFQSYDFGDVKFDVVILGEIIEHAVDDLKFLQRACDLANQVVLLTTPCGSFDRGFKPRDARTQYGQHLRAYSTVSMENLLSKLTGVTCKLEGIPENAQEFSRMYHLVRILKKKEIRHVDYSDAASNALAEDGRAEGERTEAANTSGVT
jgi:ubiquinone/menaquinone biosynthesis C-methylase UbiE